MSVLRKRSNRAIPAACLLLSALALGLTGCGGNDDEGGPIVRADLIQIPAGVVYPPAVADVQVSIDPTTGQLLVNGPVSINVPPGAVQGDPFTIGVSVTPAAQSIIEQIRSQLSVAQVGDLYTIMEYAAGNVDQNGNIDRTVAVINEPYTVSIQVSDAVAAVIQQRIGRGDRVVIYGYNPTDQNLFVGEVQNVTLQQDSTGQWVLTFVTPAEGFRSPTVIVATNSPAHLQGGSRD